MNYHCPRPPKQRAFDTSLLMWRRRFLGGAAFSPADLFASGEDGGWYDPSDLTSMFQGIDGSGGNPSVGDPVGVVLDKSQMGGQTAASFIAGQPELISTDVGDWSRGFLSVDGTLTYASGVFTHTLGAGDTSAARWVFPFSTVVGRTYRVSAIIGGTGSFVTLGFSSNSSGTGAIVSSGNPPVPGGVLYQVHFKATATTTYVAIGTSGTTGQVTTVSGLSVKEIPGNHLVAPADIQRPILRDEIVDGTSVDVSGQPELITNGTFDTDTTGWTANNATISAVEFDGRQCLSVADGGAYSQARQAITTQSGTHYLLSFAARSQGSPTALKFVVDIYQGPTVADPASPIAQRTVDLGPTYTTWTTYTLLFRATSSSTVIAPRSDGTDTAYFDNISVREVPASAARRYYLDFDGTDDCYRMGTASAQLGNEWSHVGGWKADAYGFAFSLSDTLLNGVVMDTTFDQWRYTSSHAFVDAGSSGELLSPHIITIEYDHANTVVAGRYNGGVATGSNSNTSDITLNAQGLAIGTRENDITSQVLNGRLYGGVWIDRAITTVERENLEIYMAAKTGVTL